MVNHTYHKTSFNARIEHHTFNKHILTSLYVLFQKHILTHGMRTFILPSLEKPYIHALNVFLTCVKSVTHVAPFPVYYSAIL